MKTATFSNRAINEQSAHHLNESPEYQKAVADYYYACEVRYGLYGRWVNKNTPTRNMLKALRMLPFQNTMDDWARLHVTEAFWKVK